MYTSRLASLLVVALSVLSVVESTNIFNPAIVGQDVGGVGEGIVKRQRDSSSSSVPAGTSSSTTPSSSSKPASSTSTTPSSSSSVPASTTSTTPSSSAPSSSSTSSVASSTSSDASTTSAPSTTAPPSSSSTASEHTVWSYTTETNADGSKSTLSSAIGTQTGDLQNSDSGSGSSGMSTQTRNTVIGVVVGVGGAIVLGAVGFLAWRIWGRKKNSDEADGLMGYGGGYSGAGGAPEKSEAGGSPNGRSPFQSTLESYHAPTQVNTASNF